MKRSTLSIVLGFLLAACASDPGSGGGSGSDDPPDGTSDNLTGFVIELVTNQTADDIEAVDDESFTTLSDPDGEANNTDGYESLF